MTEPVIVIHGVANRDRKEFEKAVAELQAEVGLGHKFLPVWWADLGAVSVGIEDCLPILRDGHWTVRAEEDNLSAALTRTSADTLTDAGRARLIADSASGGGSSLGTPLMRAFDSTRATVEEIALAELPSTQVLKCIDNKQVLVDLGLTIRAALFSTEPAVASLTAIAKFRTDDENLPLMRGPLDPIWDKAREIIHVVDTMLGHFVGTQLGQLNQKVRAAVAGPFALFFGDVLVYQRNQVAIQERIWTTLAAHGYTDYGTPEKPVHVVAHSLGGVIAFDAAVQPANSQALYLKSFTTFGSQAAFFHLIDRRQSLDTYQHGSPVLLPDTIPTWTNLWDTMDFLAFTASSVFRLHNGKLPVDVPVQEQLSMLVDAKGITHGVYWKSPVIVQALQQVLR